VIIGLSEELHAACLGQSVESAQNFRRVALKLIEQHPGYAVCDLEPTVESPYQVQDKTVRGEVAFIGDFPANRTVFEIVEILVITVEYGVVSKPQRLMHLEVKANRWHISYPVLGVSEYRPDPERRCFIVLTIEISRSFAGKYL